ncbi:MAG: GNAT family N-acetyltransferase [Chitinophagales bacterium]|nr:GNAT family N-acetyltransferase [Chitinophagales bacterium]
MLNPFYKIITDRLVIRCYEPKDAPLLKLSIDESISHLQPWMPWTASEPESLETKVNRIRLFRGNFDLGKDYTYGIFNREETILLGGTGLHTRQGENVLEIGYWINIHHIGKGYALEAAAAMAKIAFQLEGIKRVQIHCEPENLPSKKIPKKLGFMHEATLKKRLKTGTDRLADEMVWTLFREDFDKSPIKTMSLRLFDIQDTEIFL